MNPDSTLAVTKTCPKDGVHLSGRGRPVERPCALAPVEAGEVSACQGRPGHAVAVDVHAAWRVPLDRCLRVAPRHLVDFGLYRFALVFGASAAGSRWSEEADMRRIVVFLIGVVVLLHGAQARAGVITPGRA